MQFRSRYNSINDIQHYLTTNKTTFVKHIYVHYTNGTPVGLGSDTCSTGV